MVWNKGRSVLGRVTAPSRPPHPSTRNHTHQTAPTYPRRNSHHAAPATAHRRCTHSVRHVQVCTAAAVPYANSSNTSSSSHAPSQSDLMWRAATEAGRVNSTAMMATAAAAARGDSNATALPAMPRAKSAEAASTGPRPVVDGAGRDLGLEPFRSLVAGHRFMCTMCGKCCTGEGEIWVGPQEVERIAAHLSMSPARFLAAYTKSYSTYRGWRMLRTGESGACIFLGTDNKCSIHTVRPSQCSTYPWWPELMERGEWDWEKANVCEGFDHAEAGPLDEEEAAKQLREANKMTQLRLLASTRPLTSQVEKWAQVVLVPDEPSYMDKHGGEWDDRTRVEDRPTGSNSQMQFDGTFAGSPAASGNSKKLANPRYDGPSNLFSNGS